MNNWNNLKGNVNDIDEQTLWLLYRDKFIPCEIETDNILLQPLITAIKNNNEDDIKEEILKLIKLKREIIIDEMSEFIKDKPYRYIDVNPSILN